MTGQVTRRQESDRGQGLNQSWRTRGGCSIRWTSSSRENGMSNVPRGTCPALRAVSSIRQRAFAMARVLHGDSVAAEVERRRVVALTASSARGGPGLRFHLLLAPQDAAPLAVFGNGHTALHAHAHAGLRFFLGAKKLLEERHAT